MTSVSLPCPALPCPALPCPALPWPFRVSKTVLHYTMLHMLMLMRVHVQCPRSHLLHFTDQNCGGGGAAAAATANNASDSGGSSSSSIVLPPSETSRSLRFVFRLPPPDRMSEMDALMKFAISHCIDACARVVLSQHAKKKTVSAVQCSTVQYAPTCLRYLAS